MSRYRDLLTQFEFDRAAGRTRLAQASIEIGRDYLVAGVGLRETAKLHGVTMEKVRQVVARIHGQAGKR